MIPFFLLAIEDASVWEKYAALYNRYRQHLFGVAFSVLKDESLAEDAIQNAFLAIIEKDSLPDAEEYRIKAFLTIVVKNKAIDLLRQYSRFADEEPTDSQLGTVYQVEGSDIELALNALPVVYKDLLIEYYYVGLSAKEIADAEDVNYRTVLRRIKKAEEMLRKAMMEDEA